MPWSCKGQVIPTLSQWSYNPDIELSFAFNRTFNIFYPKILHALSSVSNLSSIDSNITSHTSALALFKTEVLYVLRSQAGFQEKTTYRSALFSSGGGKAKDALQTKATGKATSKVVKRRLAGRNQAWLLERQHHFLLGFHCIVKARLSCMIEACLPCVVGTAKGLVVTLDNLASLCRWILMHGWM